MKNLVEQIEELNEDLAKQLPAEIIKVFGKSIQDLKAKMPEGCSIKVGEKFPDFSMPDATNTLVHLKDLLKHGKVIIAFFRGSWCPYCNLELKALQNSLNQITERKATLLAVTPQAPDYNKKLKSSHQLGFKLLTDKDNVLAKQLGISFELHDYIIPAYDSLGIKLSDYNGNERNELPVPAVFVVDTNHTIVYKFVDPNYMNRIDIQELIGQL